MSGDEKGRRAARSTAAGAVREMRQIAAAHGIQSVYVDGQKKRRAASPDAVLAVLSALGFDASSMDALRACHQQRVSEAEQQICEPVIVCWRGASALHAEHEGNRPAFAVQAGAVRGQAIECELVEEGGRQHSWVVNADELARDAEASRRAGGGGDCLRVVGPAPVETGIHRLRLKAGEREAHATVLCAPHLCYGAVSKGARRIGAFLPLYAAQSARNWGVGDLRDLEALMDWAHSAGCSLFGTLPMLAGFLDEPFEPSPYSPISRVVFNELFLDLNELPPHAMNGADGNPIESGAFQEAIRGLREAPRVSYADAWQRKRAALAGLSVAAFEDGAARDSIERFARESPIVADYARFRGAIRKLGATWPNWGDAARRGELRNEDVDESERRLFLYAQWRLRGQFDKIAGDASGAELYLDLPIGVHGEGFDTWRYQDLFVSGIEVGVPPDALSAEGQRWGFPPVSPLASRRAGHAWFVEALDSHLSICGSLRLDHVAGLHRTFWIPEGMSGADGVYLQHPDEEYYAILSILSHRHEATIVGENLGTVPREVNRALKRHNVMSMDIAQFRLGAKAADPLPHPASDQMVALNTHDMPTFTAYWNGEDIDLLSRLGLLKESAVDGRRVERRQRCERVVDALSAKGYLDAGVHEETAVLDALLEYMAGFEGGILLVNLEDLWLERAPQNVPGIKDDELNWRRKAAWSLERIVEDGSLQSRLQSLVGNGSKDVSAVEPVGAVAQGAADG